LLKTGVPARYTRQDIAVLRGDVAAARRGRQRERTASLGFAQVISITVDCERPEALARNTAFPRSNRSRKPVLQNGSRSTILNTNFEKFMPKPKTTSPRRASAHGTSGSRASRGGLVIGYARVSTDDQNLALQLDALKKAGCERIFSDKLSGMRTERPGLNDALSHLRAGDALAVWKLDRLGRSVKGLVDLVTGLEGRDIHFQSLTEGIDTRTTAGRFFFHVMASLAQMERELVIERTRAGLAAARKLGRIGGRKRRMTDVKVRTARKLLDGGTPPRDVAQSLGVSIPTLYRWLPASERT
jgi:DNA invertase Pin-like site-specific DNA recombinase